MAGICVHGDEPRFRKIRTFFLISLLLISFPRAFLCHEVTDILLFTRRPVIWWKITAIQDLVR